MFNEICINEEMLPKYTYIYIYMYLCVCVCVCVCVYLRCLMLVGIKKSLVTRQIECGLFFFMRMFNSFLW